MADYERKNPWLANNEGKHYVTSVKALYYARASKCKGLAKFLLSQEAKHYFKHGYRFIGVQFNSELETKWFIKDGVQDLPSERLPIMNSYGDWALFTK